MTVLPSDGAPKAETVASGAPNEASATDAESPAGSCADAVASPADAQAGSAPVEDPVINAPRRSLGSVLMPTLLAFYTIGIALWLVFAWSGYNTKYSQATDSWKLNSTKMIEITLVAEDKTNLACASDVSVEGLHCGYDARQNKRPGDVDTDPNILQPYNTVANELFMGAGLWTSSVLKAALPGQRFTVMCNYKVMGAAKNVSLRWAPKAGFDPLKTSVAVGTLTDCVIPQ